MQSLTIIILSKSFILNHPMKSSLRNLIKILEFTSNYSLIQKRKYTFSPSMAFHDSILVHPNEPFRPKRALVLAKFSRYEFEKRKNAHLKEDDLIKNLESRGSDYQALIKHHGIHVASRDHVEKALKSRGIETKLVNRFEYTDDNIDWADVIVTSGGDGTFLMAATKVYSDKPIIGVNSDPSRSVGYLCLPKQYSNNFDEALKLLEEGNFKWKYRQRIRITLEGENAFDDPIELYNQQLNSPEYRFLDLEGKAVGTPEKSLSSLNDELNAQSNQQRVLPFRALNEVFIGESLSSRVSYYEFALDDKPKNKLKSSGVTICTGTGSTSWSFNINKVTPQCVENIFRLVNEEIGAKIPNDEKVIQRVTDRFNSSLLFDPSLPVMGYTIRDPVVFGTDFNNHPRGYAKKIEIKSRMFDACVVIDGGLSYKFNDGSKATFELFEEDVIRTIAL